MLIRSHVVICFSILLAWAVQLPAQSDSQAPKFRLAGVFGDHMVLQQNSEAPFWGTAKPDAEVVVTPSWSRQAVPTRADAAGKWETKLAIPAAGGPFEIEVQSDGKSKKLKNVMAGEVWICSGQSNMQWKLRGFGVDHFKADVEKANHPKIRFCQVPHVLALEPQDDIRTRWSVCTPKSALEFSAVAYFFGDRLREELNVPIGLISTNWGGSSGEAWVNSEVLDDKFPAFRKKLASYPAAIEKHGSVLKRGKLPKGLNHRSPAVLYNQMVRPLIPFSFRGVIWYQGESNVKEPAQYAKLFPALIENWRSEWGQGDFPFYYVQIAPFHYKTNPLPVALLREAQFQALDVPNTGMVVTMDIGDPTNIHPKPKKPVGERLALLALAKDYGRKKLVYSGPQYVSHKVERNKIRLNFEHVGGGLGSRDGKPLSHFTIAGKDKVFYPATAKVDGDSIVVRSKKVKQPVAVRYGWGNADEPNLMNKEGLPCSSFRTDQWSKATEAAMSLPSRSFRNVQSSKPVEYPVSVVSSMTAPGMPVPAKSAKIRNGKKKPNIVFMMTDELAYYELSHMGNEKLLTPNIDQMAKEGIRFTNALAAAPVCGPLRCCLMTGLHSGHSSMRNNRGGTPLRSDEFTIADMLKKNGYATGGFGKWGIGGRGSTGVPEQHGFDVFFGYYDQVHAHTYFPPHLVRNSKEVVLKGNTGGNSGETYSHYEIMKEGLNFIRENKDRPFFCYLPITPPHGMYDIPADEPSFKLYEDMPWMNDPEVSQKAKNYAAMVSLIDADLKRVFDLLKELDLDRDTLVIFSGDNGGESRFADEQHPNGYFGPNVNPKTGVVFRGQKRSLYEGALRIPFLVRWPGTIEPNQVNEHLFYQVDLMATFAELTGSELPGKTDGISIVPSLLGAEAAGRKQKEHEFMYWEFLNQFAVRKGNWKAIKPRKNKKEAGTVWELYNLENDISESNDLASEQVELVAELAAFAKAAHVPARPGKFLRNDLQKRDRTAKWKVPKPLNSTN